MVNIIRHTEHSRPAAVLHHPRLNFFSFALAGTHCRQERAVARTRVDTNGELQIEITETKGESASVRPPVSCRACRSRSRLPSRGPMSSCKCPAQKPSKFRAYKSLIHSVGRLNPQAAQRQVFFELANVRFLPAQRLSTGVGKSNHTAGWCTVGHATVMLPLMLFVIIRLSLRSG